MLKSIRAEEPATASRLPLSLLLSFLLLSFAACADDEDAQPSHTLDARPEADNGAEPLTPPAISLAELVDFSWLVDWSDLELIIETDRSGRVPGDFDDPVWQVGFRFSSQTLLGERWQHSGFLIVPSNRLLGGNFGAIIQFGTENPLPGISDSTSFLPQFGAITADRLDMPILLLGNLPPPIDLRHDPSLSAHQDLFPECFVGPIGDETQYVHCLRELSRATGRLDLYPALPIALTFSRAVTLFQLLADRAESLALDFELPPFQVDKVALLAGGFAGYSARFAMALDERIAALMTPTDVGSLRELQRLRQTRGCEHRLFGDPARELAFYDTEAGQRYLDTYDSPAIAEAIRERDYLLARGTNATAFPLGSLALYRNDLPDSLGVLLVPNYQDGFGTQEHLLAWRGFLAQVFRGRSRTSISTSFEEDGGNYTASAETSGLPMIGRVELSYVQRHLDADEAGFRDPLWRTISMSPIAAQNSWSATFTPLTQYSAFFVRVVDFESFFEGPLTSDLTFLTP